MNKKVINVNYGLGSSYDECIEINHKLSDKLRKSVMAHELRHRNGVYGKQDFLNDFQSKKSYFFDSFLFALKNPEMLVGFFPFMYSYYFKIMTFNFPALVPFLYFGLIFSGFFTVLFKVNFFMALLGYTVLFMMANIILLIITHLYVKKDKDFEYKEFKN